VIIQLEAALRTFLAHSTRFVVIYFRFLFLFFNCLDAFFFVVPNSTWPNMTLGHHDSISPHVEARKLPTSSSLDKTTSKIFQVSPELIKYSATVTSALSATSAICKPIDFLIRSPSQSDRLSCHFDIVVAIDSLFHIVASCTSAEIVVNIRRST
jgi:hypothetical protein